jgi:hypothetical protein
VPSPPLVLGCILFAVALAKWGLPPLLVGFGSALLAIALLFCLEGSGWGLFIAWVFGTWGAMLMAWGLLAGWHRSIAACVAGSAFALAAVVVALSCVQRDAWELAILCAVGSGLALIFGVYQSTCLFQRRG